MKRNINNKITRKEAIKKVGQFTALTASTLLLLKTKQASAASPGLGSPPPPGWGEDSPPSPGWDETQAHLEERKPDPNKD